MAIKIIVMAGGRGERFWPQSRKDKPKQFANILSEKSMLEETVSRFSKTFGEDNIYISSGETYLGLLVEMYPNWDKHKFILEPMGRDTAACIALCSFSIQAEDDDVLFFVPADHYIGDESTYLKEINLGLDFISQKESLLLLGILPQYPATGYGYIQLSDPISKDLCDVFQVKSFREKPDQATAEKYLASGNYLWNAGMFMAKKGVLKKAFHDLAPNHAKAVIKYLDCKSTSLDEAHPIFESMEKISFDFAVVEKLKEIFCLKTHFSWDDVGSWNALPRVIGDDEKKNLSLGKDTFLYDSASTTCVNNSKSKVIVNGVEGLNIIVNDDVVYVTSKARESNIKKILKDLSEKNPEIL